MTRHLTPALLALLLTAAASCARPQQGDWRTIPAPEHSSLSEGHFQLRENTKIYYGDSLRDAARLLAGMVRESAGFEPETAPVNVFRRVFSRGAVILEAEKAGSDPAACIPADTQEERYTVTVGRRRVVVRGNTARGCVRGAYFLRKAWDEKMRIRCGRVEDGPRFRYRGVMLDVGRHFFRFEDILQYIDILALHNMNVFHWHLTEDQGWRIAMDCRPLLAQKASQRRGTMIGKDFSSCDGIPHGGFYTKEQAMEVVRYAAERGITVIPEIDIPGHTLAALAAYPQLGCRGEGYEVWTRWGVSEDVLCPGKEETFRFLEDVFGELTEIFPSEYIHIGGDECPKTRWKECPDCRRKIRELGLESDSLHTEWQKLQAYVTGRMAGFLASKGRKTIGWDEVLEGGGAPGMTVMCWRDQAWGKKAAAAGHDVIMTPIEQLYFSRYQSADRDSEPLGPGGLVTVESVYGYDITGGFGADTALTDRILGAQACIWTEYISGYGHLLYMTLPRLAALSEVLWSPQGAAGYGDFLERLDRMAGIYESRGYRYARHATGRHTL